MAVITKFLTNSNGKMLVDSTTGKPLSLTIDVVDGLSIRLAERAAVSTTYSTFASYSTTSQTYSNITNASEFAVGDVAILQWTITDRDNTAGIIFAEVSAVSPNSITAEGLGMAVKGDSGENGAQVELRVADGQLQWKYDNQESWTVLAELSDLSALTYSTVWSAPSVPFEGLEIGLHTIYFNRSPQVDDVVTVAMGGSPNYDDTKGRSWIAVCKITGQAPGNETVTAAIITKVVETTGEKGNPGKAATIQIGTVTTGAAGSQAAVTNTGTANAAVIDFVIPQGEKGSDGVGIPAGGTVGQVLRKAGAEDYACEWAEPAGIDIVDIGTVTQLVFGNEGTGAVNISDELYNRLMVVGGVIMKFTTSDNQEIYLNGMVQSNGTVYAGTFGGAGTVMAYYGTTMGSSQKQVAIVATAIKYNEFATTNGSYPNMTVGNTTKADAIKQADTREANELPPYYYDKAYGGQNFIVEFKLCWAIGLSGQSEYCQLCTYAKWSDASGGNLTQVAVVDGNFFIRTSTGSTGWGAWEKLLKAGEAGTVVKSASEWSSQNPVLSAGQFGYDTTDKITKIGDGSTPWKTLPFFATTDLSFSKASWGQIAALSEGGSASKYFSVGDEKTIELTTGEEITLVILGLNHDDLTGGGKAGISIGMKNLLATRYSMNATNTNVGGWDESKMRTSTMVTLLSQLPSDLQSVIKQVNKKATAGGISTSIITSADKLWLLAEVEVTGTTLAGYVDEGEQYEYWKTVKDSTVLANRIKYLSNGNGSANSWWFRSPVNDNNLPFRCISSAGWDSSNGALMANGVSFGFCI